MNSKENIICNSTDPSYLWARCYVGTTMRVMQEEEHGGRSQFRLMTPKWLIRYVGLLGLSIQLEISRSKAIS